MNQSPLRRNLISIALIAPLLLFLFFFFIMPLYTMMKYSVLDDVAVLALPTTSTAIANWDQQSPPSEAIKTAFVEDIRNVTDDKQLGDLTRRLNSAQSGFRTLMSKTRKAVEGTTGPVDLAAVDKRWEDLAFWRAIKGATASTTTDRYLLESVDLERNLQGSVVAMPEDAAVNRLVISRTLLIAGSVTLACVLIGLPYAMIAASVTGWRRQVLLAAVLLPLWTSLLVRTAAWVILLQKNGLINSALMSIGIISEPLTLIYNRTGVIIAMTHVLLPFMVLPIFSVLISIPKNLMPAAASLGAPPLRAFWKVLLPLSLRGVVSGSLLVFMSALGYYITPALVGSEKEDMISSKIAYYAIKAANFGMASALGLVLLVVTIILYSVYIRLTKEQEAR